MVLVDYAIIVALIIFAIIGFKRGVFKSLVAFLGFIIIIFLAYALKNILGDIFVLNLPFIKFGNFLGGGATLNIVMYQSLAFIIILIILALIYRFLITITGIFEKLLKYTVILGIPSKLLGMVVGFLEGYVIIYLVLFFLNQPFLRVEYLDKSKYVPIILNNTPIVSSFASESLKVVSEVRDITKIKDKDEMDIQLADLLLKRKVVSPEIMQKLVDKKKIDVEGIQNVINNYSGGEKND